MNRQQRRAMAKLDQREHCIRLTEQERHDIVVRAQKTAWENVIPIFLLYLVDHFHCKERGIQKFMDWFNEIDAWCGGDRDRLRLLLEEASERSNTTIEYCTSIMPNIK